MTIDRYSELAKEFPLRPIRSERQLEQASGIVWRLASRSSLSRGERDYLEVLSDLIEKYEDLHHAIPTTLSGVEALSYLIEENGLTFSRLAAETGIPVSTLSEILKGKRELNLNHVERLCVRFRVDPGLFVRLPTPATVGAKSPIGGC